ncbi:hypothetical protein J2W97_001370 [Paenibacillus jamilae]|nr:hypothetical protein [Paenibacillus jamilae]
MNKKKLEELFYSKEMEQIRLDYYNNAYNQGKFDETLKKMNPETLINMHDGDFEVWKGKVWYSDKDQYNISVEGYMGFETIQQGIELYEMFNAELLRYIEQNGGLKGRHEWKKVYHTRAVEISNEHDSYWIFLDGYKSEEISDLYWYMCDVIEQLKRLNKNLNITKIMKEVAYENSTRFTN